MSKETVVANLLPAQLLEEYLHRYTLERDHKARQTLMDLGVFDLPPEEDLTLSHNSPLRLGRNA